MQISTTLPNKFIRFVIQDIIEEETWPYEGQPGDVWEDAVYRWRLTASVVSQTHSSPFTPTPYEYGPTDITVGMWIASGDPAVAVKIISIEDTGFDSIEVIVEDVERFNTFYDPTGNGQGIFPTGDAWCFEVAEDGLPIIFPFSNSAVVGPFFSNDLISRFRINNPRFRFRIDQTAHGFQVGDELYLDPDDGLYKLLVAGRQPIGRVVDVSDSPDTFLISPVGRIDEALDLTGLGDPGDIIYYDDSVPGGLTLTQNSRRAYVKITDTSAMRLDQGEAGTSSVVDVYPDIASLPVSALTGQLAYVTDQGNGEWIMYVYTVDNEWVKIADEDSARTDADTLQLVLDYDTIDAINGIQIGTVSDNSRITLISVEIAEPFDDPNAELTIGTVGEPDKLMKASLVDLTSADATFITQTEHLFKGGDTEIVAFLDSGDSTEGSVIINVTYV